LIANFSIWLLFMKLMRGGFMSKIVKSFFSVSLLTLSLLSTGFPQLSAYVSIPRSEADSTYRMNFTGDPPTRAGLRDLQRSPEYLDDWWGRNDYYYSAYGRQSTGGNNIYNPYYAGSGPPTYPLPNSFYDYEGTNSQPYYNRVNPYYNRYYPYR